MIRILITSHGGMARGMAESVQMLIGEQDCLDVITFEDEMGLDELEERYGEALRDASNDKQYLVLCDIMGGTPFNMVSKYSYGNKNIKVLYGMNLPLLTEALVDRLSGDKKLDELTADLQKKAVSSIGFSEL